MIVKFRNVHDDVEWVEEFEDEEDLWVYMSERQIDPDWVEMDYEWKGDEQYGTLYKWSVIIRSARQLRNQ